uniref:Uncharacterized protein n=1 Tax=Vespula pensylvanica TaxID=30213 RepID=A0A834JVT9_VESPE|nr:hypothetical protein H0235_017460 [Vespula pensylvanica]
MRFKLVPNIQNAFACFFQHFWYKSYQPNKCEIDNEKYFSISGAMGTPGYITLLFQDLFRVHLVKKCGKLRNILRIDILRKNSMKNKSTTGKKFVMGFICPMSLKFLCCRPNDARHHEKNEANISCILAPGNSESAIIEMMVNEIAAAIAAMQLKWMPDD